MFFSIVTLQNLNRQANKIVLQPIYEVSSKCQNCFNHVSEEVIEIVNMKSICLKHLCILDVQKALKINLNIH